MSGRLFGRESAAALVVSGRLFGRELAAALFNKSDRSGYLETVQVCQKRFVGSVLTFQELGQSVKRPLYAQRKRVISWLISVIVDARSQLEYAKRDKSEGNDDNVSK